MRTLAPAVASLAAAALVLIPTAASAERWTHHDAKGDVMQANYDPESDTGTFTNVPNDTATDIRRVIVTHGANQLRASIHVENITAGTKVAVYRIRTSDGRNFDAVRFRAPGFTGFSLTRAGAAGKPVKCSGKSLSIDKDTDVATLVVPRKCIGDPRWVRVGAGYSTSPGQDNMFGPQNVDDGLRTRMTNGSNLRLSDRITRG